MDQLLKIKRFTGKYGIYLALLILCILLAILIPPFARPGNLLNILRQISTNGIVAVGMTFVILTGGIDLSTGSILALTSVLAASFAHPGEYPFIIPLFIALAAGAACGAINGLLISKKKIPPFIATLGMMTAARGSALVYTNGRPVIGLDESYTAIGGGYIFHIPIPVIIFLLVALAGAFMLRYTRFGRHVYATGGNELAAKISGVRTDRKITAVYIIAGLLSGLAGIILSSRVMAGSPVGGAGYELDAIAATVIGGTSLKGGTGSITGTIVGALIIGVMNNGLDLSGVSSYWQQIVKGTIIVLAVMLDRRS